MDLGANNQFLKELTMAKDITLFAPSNEAWKEHSVQNIIRLVYIPIKMINENINIRFDWENMNHILFLQKQSKAQGNSKSTSSARKTADGCNYTQQFESGR